MDNKYFSSLNGYLVKDTDARNGVSDVNAKLNATNTNVSNNKTNIATNTKDIASLKTSVTNVNAKADFNTANLESLQSSVNTVKIDNDKNKTDLALLNEKVNGIDGINAQLETTIERVTTAEENISTNTANIQNIQMGLNAIHTHDNKATLDMITPADIEKWNSGTGGGSSEPTLDIYSNEETKTNKVWINGKPIYRKVITCTGTNTSFPIDISGLNVETFFINETQSVINYGETNVPLVRYGSGTNYTSWSRSGNTIYIALGSEYAMDKLVHVCVEYTKVG